MPLSVSIFCGASSGQDPSFAALAYDIGTVCANENMQVVYGGAKTGLMGKMADGALDHGGRVIGVLPHCLENREVGHKGLTKLYKVETLHERQQKMMDLSDLFLILPGGYGTLAEFFEVLTWKQIGLHNKKIIVLNANEYWTPLLYLLTHCQTQGYARNNNNSPEPEVVNNLKDFSNLIKILKKERLE